MKKITFLLFLASLFTLTSCVTTKEVRYLQPSESLTINEEGLIPYNVPIYRVTKNDIFNLNIVTTPMGDAAQFYSRFNTSGGENAGNNSGTTGGAVGGVSNSGGGVGQGSTASILGNREFYFNGLRVDSKGNINILGILEPIKAEGRTIEDIEKDIQQKVNENFLAGKAQVRLNLDGISYYVLGDIETTGVTGPKKAYVNQLSIIEALAANGGLNRTIDRKNIMLQRMYPEGIKTVHLDLTREDVQNSQYFWIQNGDMIYLNTKAKSFYGFGKEPLQTLTTGVSLLTTALSIYLIVTRL